MKHAKLQPLDGQNLFETTQDKHHISTPRDSAIAGLHERDMVSYYQNPLIIVERSCMFFFLIFYRSYYIIPLQFLL